MTHPTTLLHPIFVLFARQLGYYTSKILPRRRYLRAARRHLSARSSTMNNPFKSTASAARTISRTRFQAYTLPSIRLASTRSHNVPKLNDPSLLKTNVAYVNGEWVGAKSGKTFEVTGKNSRLDGKAKLTRLQTPPLAT